MATGPNIDCRLMLLVVDVGNTQTHFGTWRDDELVEHWRFATGGQATPRQPGPARRSLLALRGVPPQGPTSATRCSSSAPGSGPACRCATTTRARSAPTGS